MSSLPAAVETQQPSQATNRPLVSATLISLTLPLVALLYFSSFRTLAHNWVDFDNLGYTHGWLIVACVIWLIYEVAKESPQVVFSPSIRGCLALAGTSLLWLIAFAMNVQLAQQVMLPLLVLGCLYALFGYATARRFLFPITYLYFAIGIWGALTSTLQWGTVYAMRVLLRIIAIPAYFEGNMIHLPSGPIAVEGACSGLNFFVVAIAIAAFYGYINRIRRWLLLIVFAALFAIVANWLRVLTIVIAGHLTNMQHYLITVEHIRFGWCVFAVMMAGFLIVASKFESSVTEPSQNPSATNGQLKVSAIAFFVFAIAIGPVWSLGSQIAWQNAEVDRSHLQLAPNWIEQSATSSVSNSSWRPVFVGSSSSGVRAFQYGGQRVEVFEASYRGQSQSAKLAGYDNTLLGGLLIVAKEGSVGTMQQSIVSDDTGTRWLMRHAYISGGQIFDKAIEAQISAGLWSLIKPTAAAVVAVRARCAGDCSEASHALDQFSLNLSRS